MDNPIDPRRLAQTAYASKIDQIAKLQRRILLNEQLEARFGSVAIADGVMQNLQTLTDAEERMARALSRDVEQLKELYAEVRHLEGLFAEANDADMEAMAEYFRSRMRGDK